MGKKKTQEEFINDIIKIYNIKETDFALLTPYIGWDKPITFKCLRCGQEKTINADSLRRKGRNKKNICRCYGYDEKWFQLKNDFDNWKKKQKNYEILEDFKGNTINILVKCKKCNALQKRSIQSLISDCDCQNCQTKQGIKKTHQQFVRELDELYCGEYNAVQEYVDANTPILIKHTICGKIYYAKPHNILSNKGGHCPICGITSKGEKAIKNFLNKNDILFETQKRLECFKRAPYDFYLPQHNLLIEYQGIQHFQPVDKFGGEKAFKRQQEIDEIKKTNAIQEGFNYLSIPYHEFNNIDSLLAQRLSLTGVAQAKQQPSQLRDEDIV